MQNRVARIKHLINLKRELLREYALLLDDGDVNEKYILADLEVELFPRSAYIGNMCPLREQGGDMMHMLTGPGERGRGLKELRDFTREVRSLIIVDPYFFSGASDSASGIADDFKKCARVDGRWLEQVHVIHAGSKVTTSVKKEIFELSVKNKVKLTTAETGEIHDRVWIADRKEALVVGTSLNGIGSRAAFLLPLPESDLRAVLEFLDDRQLSRSV